MNDYYGVPRLNIYQSGKKRTKTKGQRTSKSKQCTRCHSSRHQTYSKTERYSSPIANGKDYRFVDLSTGRIEEYPTDYLDYGPEMHGYYSPRYQSSQRYEKESNSRWQVPQRDTIQKEDMYTQTSKMKQELRAQFQSEKKRILENKSVQIDSLDSQRGYWQGNGSFQPQIPNQSKQSEESFRVIPQRQPEYTVKVLQDQNSFDHKPQIEPKKPISPIREQNSHESSVNNYQKYQKHKQNQEHQENLVVPKHEASIIEPEYKKTFSQAILDQLFEKGLQEEYEEKYNKDKRFSQIIIGKVERTTQIKKAFVPPPEIIRAQTNVIKKEEKKETNFQQTFNQRQFWKNERNFESNTHQNASKFRIVQPEIPPQAPKRPLHNENTINLLINKSDEKPHPNFRNSLVQTNDQSNQASRNQVMQTDNSQSTLVIQKLIRNVIDDKEFRRRLNQKTDQYNRIKVQFQDNPEVDLRPLVESKEVYIKESKEFLSKLNLLIEEDQRSTVRVRTQEVRNRSPVPSQYQLPPLPPRNPLSTNKNKIMPVPVPIPVKNQQSTPITLNQFANHSSQHRIVSTPVSVTVLPSVQHPFQGYPHPSQIIEQVPYRTFPQAKRQM